MPIITVINAMNTIARKFIESDSITLGATTKPCIKTEQVSIPSQIDEATITTNGTTIRETTQTSIRSQSKPKPTKINNAKKTPSKLTLRRMTFQ